MIRLDILLHVCYIIQVRMPMDRNSFYIIIMDKSYAVGQRLSSLIVYE